MEDAVRKGIEKANEDLRKENEKILSEKVSLINSVSSIKTF